MHSSFDVVGGPSSFILEQADGSNGSFLAEVEPVLGAGRNADPIACDHFDAEDVTPILWVDVEQPSTFDDEADFVFGVDMFFIELVDHCIQAGSLWIDIDHISGDEATFSFQFLNLGCVGCQNLFIGCICVAAVLQRSPFIANAEGT